MSISERRLFDIAIVGAGLVGLSAAYAAAKSAPERQIVVLEAKSEAAVVPLREGRTLALAHHTVLFYQRMGLWDAIAEEAVPINELKLVQLTDAAQAHIDVSRLGIAALGYVVPAYHLHKILLAAVNALSNVQCLWECMVASLLTINSGVQLGLHYAGRQHEMTAQLLIGAEGRNSMTRRLVNIPFVAEQGKYTAWIFHLHLSKATPCAFEFFMPSGEAVAVLPLKDSHRMVLIWMMHADHAQHLAGLDEAYWNKKLNTTFASWLGDCHLVSMPPPIPLMSGYAKEIARPHMMWIGEAANMLYPLGAQGFNLAVRDIEGMVAMLQQSHHLGAWNELADYVKQRRNQQRYTRGFVAGLSFCFGLRHWPATAVRTVGLKWINQWPGMQRYFLDKLS